MESIIRDITLAKSGHEKINWVDRHMPALNAIGDKLKAEQTFKGKTICVSVHLEAKTAYLAEVLHRAGAKVIVTGSNPLSTRMTSQPLSSKTALRSMLGTVRPTKNTSTSSINPSTTIRTSSSMTAATRSTSCTRRGPTLWKTSSVARKKRRPVSIASTASTKPAS